MVSFRRGVWKEKDLKNALRCFNHAIELNQDNPEAFNARGLIYAAQNDTQLALKDFKRALQLHPLSYKYNESLIRINFLSKNSQIDFLGYWGRTAKRKTVCVLLILSLFFVYFASPILVTYIDESIKTETDGTTLNRVINSKIPEIYSIGLLILIICILFSHYYEEQK